jgi:hypothetical protein
MRRERHGPALGGLLVLALALWMGACETTRNPGGIQRDITEPAILLTNTSGDTQDIAGGLRFNISAVDNLALKSIRLTFSGGLIGQIDTTFTGQVKTYTAGRTLVFSPSSGAGGGITIVGRATDGAGNFSEDTIFIFLSNVQALRVTMNQPLPGALASAGKGIPVEIQAVQQSGIAKIGFLVSPAGSVTNPTVPPNDSLVFTAPLADSVVYTDTLIVVQTTGTFNIVGFAEDSAGRRGFTNVVTVGIQSVANDLTVPIVAHKVAARVEVDDSIIVRGQDPSAIEWIGFKVDTNGVQMKFDSVNVGAGNLTDVTRRFNLGLQGLSPLPRSIVVKGYACDRAAARNCSFTNNTTILPIAPSLLGPQRAANALIDTIVVVSGVTVALPFGGRIADAIFNGNDSSLYLTNPNLGRVEIFQVANTTFVAAGIPTVGPQPWGIALWPRDTLGNYGDSIVVANSGGVELSIIDVRPGIRRLAWRQDLPDYLIETYRILTAPLREEIRVFDVSDRPQYVSTVCRVVTGGSACHSDSIFAIYSTTPTLSSTTPFSGRGTLRMEKLVNTNNPDSLFSHLFWELAGDSTLSSTSRDTLRIEMRRGRPYNVQTVQLSACQGVTIELATFGLGDSTYVRNSGNFTHAIMGEGGNITTQFARVVGYTTKANLIHGSGTARFCATNPALDVFGRPLVSDSGENHRDLGVTPAIDVSDFISNTGVNIHSVATNFNGQTNLVRADSIYFLDEGMKLKGTAPAPIGAFGMDMNYNHAFSANDPGTPTFPPAVGVPADRIAFSARPDGNIDVWDTFFYGRIGGIVVRDPITGPLRVARNRANTRQWLFGVTGNGVVMIELPVITNPFPARPPWGPPIR